MTRNDILKIQRLLKSLRLYRGKIDGLYGIKTKKALYKYQIAHGLYPDGIYGPKTKAEMFPDDKKIIKSTKTNFNIPIEPSELDEIYGNPKDINKNQKDFLAVAVIPYDLRLAWNPLKTTKKIYIHRKSKDKFISFFNMIKNEFTKKEIKEFGLDLYGGSYSYRKIRGGTRWSTHAYGIAIDLNPAHNRLREHSPEALFSKKEVKYRLNEICNSIELYSLGYNHNYDYMHFQDAKR